MTNPADDRPDEEWRRKLTPEQYQILRAKGTERAFTGKYDKLFDDGNYLCAGCGQVLFTSDAKYNSGTGWPAFTEPSKQAAVMHAQDSMHDMERTEAICSNCRGHLGHVFPDGPTQAGGMRYCINSAALDFVPKK